MQGREWSKEARHSRGRRWFPTDRGLRIPAWRWCLSGRWVSQNFIMLQKRGRGWGRLWPHSWAHLHLQKMQSWTDCPKDNALSHRKWSDLLSLWSKERPGEWKTCRSQMQHGTKHGREESELLGVNDKEFVDVAPVAWSAKELSFTSGQQEDPPLKVWLSLKVLEMHACQY